MAKAVILNKQTGITKSIKSSDYSDVKVSGIDHEVLVIKTDNLLKGVKASNYSIAVASTSLKKSTIQSNLPFRVRFTNIGITGYSATNVPSLGIAIIGINNYIL